MPLKIIYICLILQIFFVGNNNLISQNLFYQDICNCGVTVAGFSVSTGAGEGSFDIYIEPGSTIRKAYLFTAEHVVDQLNSAVLTFNNLQFECNKSPITSFSTESKNDVIINAFDVTNIIDVNQTTHHVTFPLLCKCSMVYLYILYENPSLETISTYVYANDVNEKYETVYESEKLNSVKFNSPIGFSIFSDRIGEYPDASFLSFDNGNNWENVGLIGGIDNVNHLFSGGGVKGHFYFQNNQLFGLDDDTPDYHVNGSDGLIDVRHYLSDINNLKWSLVYELYSNVTRYNIYQGFFITHSTPCNPFPISISKDTTICKGSFLQLNTSGGQRYEWLSSTGTNTNPAPGLSCSDCPNPIFSGDSSIVYTVRIWNNDDCSVVHPVYITVLPSSNSNKFNAYDTKCSTPNSGVIQLQSTSETQHFYAVNENGDTLINTGNYITNLPAGEYTVYSTDSNNCKSFDTLIKINYQKEVTADFTVVPNSGGAPLNIQITNTSQNATDYQWSINGTLIGEIPPLIFDTAGVYQIQLVAWNTDPHCVDTITKTVLVYDSLIVEIPNVFSPNGDGINDVFTISTNIPIQVKINVLNRWGNEVFTYNNALNAGSTIIWDGKTNSGQTLSNGTYFYKAVFSLNEDEINCEMIKCKIEKSGFITIFR